MNLAIIPARKGSQRIKNKNIKNFYGLPIIVWTIRSAIASRLFDEIMVSTNDKKIAKVAIKYGAKVPFMRSEKNSNAYASTFDAIHEVIDDYKKKGKIFDKICCLYPAAPLITPKLIKNCYHQLLKKNFSIVLPVVRIGKILRAYLRKKNGTLKRIDKKFDTYRSQDLPESYADSGQLYWIKVHPFSKAKVISDLNIGSIVIPESNSQNIDTEEDWNLAKKKFKKLKLYKKVK